MHLADRLASLPLDPGRMRRNSQKYDESADLAMGFSEKTPLGMDCVCVCVCSSFRPEALGLKGS
jgi:hypothetical protein